VTQSLVILGSGYTARFVLPLAERQYARVLATSREPERHLSHVQPDRWIRFDLTQQGTWHNIPTDADLLWCFPATPLDLVKQFAATLGPRSRRLVVLGSTSAYTAGASSEYPPPWIDETAPIDLAQPRVEGEEFLRTHCAAVILRVAGIYGPDRNPIDWIKRGRVGPSRKYVNLIHVEDLAAICLAGLERGIPGEVYNVSDGTPRTWKDICRTAQDRWGIQPSVEIDDASTGKRIANGKLLSLLGSTQKSLAHSDLYRSLRQLHSGQAVT
jgi:nucleoside-diphosphate-sugar epimerase